MSMLRFSRNNHTIYLYDSSGQITPLDAYNNFDSKFKPWPNGTYDFAYLKTHSDDGPDSAYGSYGIIVFTVPNREGMGVHSGRKNKADGRGRKGPEHATYGCIRTTDEAMKAILALHATDAIVQISVADDLRQVRVRRTPRVVKKPKGKRNTTAGKSSKEIRRVGAKRSKKSVKNKKK